MCISVCRSASHDAEETGKHLYFFALILCAEYREKFMCKKISYSASKNSIYPPSYMARATTLTTRDGIYESFVQANTALMTEIPWHT
jgi:hypothetical protein